MTRKTMLTAAFLAVTTVAVGWELAAAAYPGDDLVPWTTLIVDYVPAPITFAAIALLTSFLGPHFIEAYARKKKGTTMDTTIPATPKPGAPKEPLLSVGTVTAVAAAALAVAVAFGWRLNDTQTSTVLGLIGVIAPLIVAIAGRAKVFSPATTRAMVVRAARTGRVATEPTTAPEVDQL